MKQAARRAARRTKAVAVKRLIYSANNRTTLPGKLVRSEGDPPTGDPAVDEAYDGLGLAHEFFWYAFSRDSIDGRGGSMEAVVHYGESFDNAFWNGRQVIFGDGDGKYFQRWTIAPDIIAKKVADGVVTASSKLVYWEQTGALMSSISNIFAVLAHQYGSRLAACEDDWLLAKGVLAPGIRGRALYSLAEPGTAYDDPGLGKDSQPSHMRGYVRTKDDFGGVHINSGIPSRAFYLAAVALGGYAWEKAGLIWYEAMRDPKLKPNARFADFARLTLLQSRKLYGKGSDEELAVRFGWRLVGVLKQ